MTDRDPHPDSPPTDAQDDRSDIERVVDRRKDEAGENAGGDTTSPLEPTGQPDGVAGTGGVTKNQEDDAQ